MLGECLFQFSGREFPSGGASVLVELFARGFIGQIWPARVEDVTGTWIGAKVGDLVSGDVVALWLEGQGHVQGRLLCGEAEEVESGKWKAAIRETRKGTRKGSRTERIPDWRRGAGEV